MVKEVKGRYLVTADHGNADDMAQVGLGCALGIRLCAVLGAVSSAGGVATSRGNADDMAQVGCPLSLLAAVHGSAPGCALLGSGLRCRLCCRQPLQRRQHGAGGFVQCVVAAPLAKLHKNSRSRDP